MEHRHRRGFNLMERSAERGFQRHLFAHQAIIRRIKAPVKIVIPPDVYHKFVALDDVIGVELKPDLQEEKNPAAGA